MPGRMRTTIRILWAAVFLAMCTTIPAPAQQGSEEPPPDPPVEGDPGAGGVWNTAAGKALSTFCVITPATRPSRVAPGESADFFLVLSLMDTHVIPGTGKVELAYQRQQGPIALGDWQIDPPAPGRLAKAFHDRPVYENTTKIRLPITVQPDARHGKYPIRLKVTAEIANGQSGSLVGKFFEEVTHEVHVGPPMPRPRGIAPRVRTRRSGGGAQDNLRAPGSQDGFESSAPAATGPARSAPQSPGDAIRAPVGTEDTAEHSDAAGAPPQAEESPADLALLVVAGIAVLAVGLLVALRVLRR